MIGRIVTCTHNLNSNNELVGIHFAPDVKDDDSRDAYGVYFALEIKKLIAENIGKQSNCFRTSVAIYFKL